ncbi:MAG: DUF6314 family protein [Acidimicrobiales bacterium]
MNVDDTLAYLLGRWSVHRSLSSDDGGRGTFTGVGVFAAQPCADASAWRRWARYEETGDLCFGAYSGSATRQLHYVAGADGRRVVVLFTDGRSFVDLDLTAGSWTACHPCAADLYEISTRVLSSDRVEERWRVRGPTKSYDAVTTMTRLAS